LLILGLAKLAYAETQQFYAIQDFSKGMANHFSPYVIQSNQASDLLNVRFNNQYGSLSKRPAMIQHGTLGAPGKSIHRFYKSDATQQTLATASTYLYLVSDSGDTSVLKDNLTEGKRHDIVTYKDKAIGTNGYDNNWKYDGHTATGVADADRTENNLVADLGAPFATLDAGDGLNTGAWYQYRMAFYDGALYSYSTARSNPILTDSDDTTALGIELTDVPIGPDGTTTRYVYRTLGGASRAVVLADTSFYLIATVSDNSTLTVSDDMGDDTADNDASPTWTTVSAGTNVTPPTGKYNIIQSSRLFISGNTTNQSDLYWSDEFNPDYFDPEDYEPCRPDDGDVVTGLEPVLGILCVFKTNSIQKFYTEETDLARWYFSEPFSYVGCPAPATISLTPLGVFYLSRKNGIYRFNAQTSILMSDAVTPTIRDISQTYIDNAFGYYFNNEYSLCYTSEDSGDTHNNRVLIYDIIREGYTHDEKKINTMHGFSSGTDLGIIWSLGSDDDGTIYRHELGETLLNKNKKIEFDNGTYDDVNSFGTEGAPVLELSWDCTINTWLTELQTKDASISTLDDILTYLPNAIIDRPDTSGTWTSPVYQINATSLSTIKWNENLNSVGDITAQIRTGATVVALEAASWGTAYSDPNGSDLSAETAAKFIQVRFNLSTTDITVTPQLFVAQGYLFRVGYSLEGQTKEAAYYSYWKSGWTNFNVEGLKTQINRIKIFYTGDEGILTFRYTNEESDVTNSFDIDLSVNPDDSQTDEYRGRGTNKYFTYSTPRTYGEEIIPIGRYWFFEIEENSNNEPFKIQKLEFMFEVISDVYD